MGVRLNLNVFEFRRDTTGLALEPLPPDGSAKKGQQEKHNRNEGTSCFEYIESLPPGRCRSVKRSDFLKTEFRGRRGNGF